MAVTHKLLISADTLKQNTTISQNVDENLIHPVIMVAQDQYIQPILGTDLFNYLKDNFDTPLTGDYETLLNDYIQKPLCYWSLMTLYPVLKYRAVNHSVVSMNNEQGQTATYDELKPLMSSAEDTAQFYTERLIDYLQKNSSLFSQYSTNTNNQLGATTRNYYSGLNMDRNYLPNERLRNILVMKGYNIC
tara:strand:- start:342 stop:911 length:570 start_codon:yes stop_codon:yes gene_type:complete